MLLAYFVVTVILTVPFLWVGAATGIELMPGLPVAALAAIAPALAAILVTAWMGGKAGLAGLVARLADVVRLPPAGWLSGICVGAAGPALSWVAHWWRGDSVIFSAAAVMALPLFLLAAAGEEIGWTGFATDRLVSRFGRLPASLLLGLFWAVWHYPALLEAHRGLEWIGWWSLMTIAMRMLMTQLYFAFGRSLAGAILFHATANFAWQLAPAAFDPMIAALAMLTLAVSGELLGRLRHSGWA